MRLEEEIKQKTFPNEFSKAVVNILYTYSYVYVNIQRFLKKYSLTPEQYNVLRILRGQYPEPCTINTIQDRMLNKTSNASRLVDKLVAKNLAERQLNASDRRQVDVILSKNGIQLLAELDKPVSELHKQIVQLPETEARYLNQLLDKLRG
ncbi:MarR family winged helix-turn-helix transcriptional regulator [Schleiferia thermophila]|jgi:DNA-binding MarR family transcriptional regulator|uniref:DNA-binding MarR family transcriptional regulator n=1 Tax=Schleiferia thermophila TaxID=884107 RepID=A0A368ZVY5_9FLAO|nr:MarR family transcriptional regulator [Schleiferia thermophila]KFD38256.1 transcriptional regulator [Schleiferia thermophila str. Yellowstone]RCX01113.1 DNA-binding MarR family transcriptional regulator [Schleiferia thermophila]GCD80243.1 MarR family transcriptional regulator [Schleiferia thermophila]